MRNPTPANMSKGCLSGITDDPEYGWRKIIKYLKKPLDLAEITKSSVIEDSKEIQKDLLLDNEYWHDDRWQGGL